MPDEDQLASLRIDRDAPGERSVWPWIVLVVGVLGILGAAAWWHLGVAVPEVRTVVAAEVRPGGSGSGGETVLNATGYVTARRRATISSKVTGRIVEVLIEEGMEVREGQLLARLDDTNVRASLELAESELRAARTALEETRVRLREAEIDLERIRSLVEGNVLSQAELDRAQAQYDSLKARIEARRDEIRVAERRVEVWRREMADREIRAPFAGIVVSKNAQPGEMISPVSAGGGFTRTGIATIVDMDSLEIEVDVNESYINRVSPGQPVEAVLDAYPDWRIPARVIAIVPTADRQTATVKVRVAFEETDPRILPEMGVKVAFHAEGEGSPGSSGPSATGVTVPADAVRRDGGEDVVFVVRDGRLERRAVRLGPERGGDRLTIVSGVTAGEEVVIEGPEELTDGQRIREAGE